MSDDPITVLDRVSARSLLAEHAPGLPVELLTRKQALVLYLRYVRDESFEDIGRILHSSRGAAWHLHERACVVVDEYLLYFANGEDDNTSAPDQRL